ncbi:membrane protein [Escherichia coli]|nr:membrane protein [Escherichia coli]
MGKVQLKINENKMEVSVGNDSNLLIVFYVQIMPDDFVMQLHRF